jgi:hypothetical protein
VKEDKKVAKIICASFCSALARRGLQSMPADRSQGKTPTKPHQLPRRGSVAPKPALVLAFGAFWKPQIFEGDVFGKPYISSR